jgi:phthalate 4,5-dioxygenase oxygenase subunit
MQTGNFTGIQGIPNQDIAMWEGMGSISDRTTERLGASDVAVAAFRRLMVEAARTMQNGGPAIGATSPRIPHATISSYEGVVPKTVNWRTLGGGSEAARERVA